MPKNEDVLGAVDIRCLMLAKDLIKLWEQRAQLSLREGVGVNAIVKFQNGTDLLEELYDAFAAAAARPIGPFPLVDKTAKSIPTVRCLVHFDQSHNADWSQRWLRNDETAFEATVTWRTTLERSDYLHSYLSLPKNKRSIAVLLYLDLLNRVSLERARKLKEAALPLSFFNKLIDELSRLRVCKWCAKDLSKVKSKRQVEYCRNEDKCKNARNRFVSVVSERIRFKGGLAEHIASHVCRAIVQNS